MVTGMVITEPTVTLTFCWKMVAKPCWLIFSS